MYHNADHGAVTMGKKRSADGGTAATKDTTPATANMTADMPLILTLRDVEVPPPPTQASTPVDDGLVLSDTELQPEPYLGDPDADRAAQRTARRAQVRKDRLRETTPDAGLVAAAGSPEAIAASRPVPQAPAVSALPALDAIPTESAVPVARATTQASSAPPVSATPPASAKPTASPTSPAAAGSRQAVTAPTTPAILVLRVTGADPDPLCDQLKAFGFDVQVRQDLPHLPAPWPFVAVFIDQALRPVDGGDAIDLCNEVRERSRLPGVLKPVLVLVADQLSATNRVRAGLAGCNEILLGGITRGTVAQVLDTRGIKLPSDSRRT
jgi:hypothetical protein